MATVGLGLLSMGDKFDLSGDFRGSIVNIKSELKNVQQTVGEINTADPDARLRAVAGADRLAGLRNSRFTVPVRW